MFAFEMCCDILNAVLHFARDERHFVCTILRFVCKVLKTCAVGKTVIALLISIMSTLFFFCCVQPVYICFIP